jgi:DNA primase
MIAPYSLRATVKAPVSTPLEWREVRKGLKPEEFNIFTVVERKASPWEGMLEDKQKLEVS